MRYWVVTVGLVLSQVETWDQEPCNALIFREEYDDLEVARRAAASWGTHHRARVLVVEGEP